MKNTTVCGPACGFRGRMIPDLDRMTLLLELLDSTATSNGRFLERYSWTVVDHSETVLVEAVALMLTHPREGSPAS